MTLKDLFAVVSDQQEVLLRGDGFDEVKAFKTTLESVLTEKVLSAKIDCVEADYEGYLKVWVKCA